MDQVRMRAYTGTYDGRTVQVRLVDWYGKVTIEIHDGFEWLPVSELPTQEGN